jgi:hypothetical protein
MLLKTYKNVNISDIDDVESYIMVRDLSVQEAAIPTSEFDYDLKKFYDKVMELEDQNQHGEVAEMLVNLYGTGPESMVIRGINGMHSAQGSIMPEQQKLRDMISNKYYNKLEQEIKKLKSTSPAYTMKKEGFASDAQRKAAFASGYKPKKKKTEDRYPPSKMSPFKSLEKGPFKDKYVPPVEMPDGRKYIGKGPFKDKGYVPPAKMPTGRFNEGMEDKIEKDIDAGMSTDAIVGKYANKRTTNTDEIRKIIQRIKFKKFKGRN